jgi:primosomal protein N' (replication factor Y) (superfamily II helicase)
MFYYEVAISGKQRGQTNVFTYSHPDKLDIGRIVGVTVRGKKAQGFIVKISSKPTYNTLGIASVSSHSLPKSSINTYLDLTLTYPISGAYLASLFMTSGVDGKVDELAPRDAISIPPLSPHQRAAFEQILSSNTSCLLYGDTGTGKTRLYIHLIENELKQGKNVLLLAPEIGLASFLYEEISKYFSRTILYHSGLTPKKRRSAWVASEQSSGGIVVVGPRSALGLPLGNIGTVILDEAHDQSYRQDGLPFVHSRVFAALLAKNNSAVCIYGSATPLVSDYYQAETLGMPIVKLTELAVGTNKTYDVHILDYKDDKQKMSSGSLLKDARHTLEATFKAGKQALILSNRRGTARYVSCTSCGHEERCESCDHLLIYHHDLHQLRCHFCMTKYPVPTSCSSCGQDTMTMRSEGTKAIATEIQSLFSDINLMRFDTDNLKADHLSGHIDRIKSGEVDCIVGTQMIAKGLDLPNLKTLIVIGGGSFSSGFASEEREFQLLYQVIGRAIRGHQDTDIYIQTSSPDSSLLKHTVARDYDSFYREEIALRKKFDYPPFCHMMVVHYSRKSSKSAANSGRDIMTKILDQNQKVSISEPTPNTTERISTDYNWHILVKSKKRSRLYEIAESLGTSVVCELDPAELP